MANQVFVLWGEGNRGKDTLFGKEWMEGKKDRATIKKVLLNNFNGFYSEDGLDSYMDEWLDEEDSVLYFADDWGNYIYVGNSKKEAVDIWTKYT